MDTDTNKVRILRLDIQKLDLLEYVKRDELLWKSPIFNGLDYKTKVSLLKSGFVRLAQNEEILLEQAPSKDLALVLDGSVSLTTQDGTIDLATLTKGDFYGLTSVFKNAPEVQASAGPDGARVAILDGKKVTSLASTIESFGKTLARQAKERSIRACECMDFMDKW